MSDMSEKVAAADEGAQRAIDHADRVHEIDWAETAMSYLLGFVKSNSKPFLCETLRGHAEANGCPPPPDARAWGGIMRRADNAGIIRKAGISYAGSHARFATLWEAVR